MFRKDGKRSWLKIESARGRIARQCHESLTEACGETALSYRTVMRWLKTINEGRGSVIYLAQSACPSINDKQVQAVAALLDTDRCHIRFRTVPEIMQAIDRSVATSC
ncbi:hypothetical protein Trydic_g2202 [Trypoxylus dichotomus]